MDDVKLKRLQKLFGEEDVWEEPKTAIQSRSQKGKPHAKMDVPHNLESDIKDDYNIGGSQKCHQAFALGVYHRDMMTAATIRPQLSPADLEKVEFPVFSGQMGDVAPKEERFTPLSLAINYPSLYIGNTNRNRAAPFFTWHSLLGRQTWDIYYIWHPHEPKR